MSDGPSRLVVTVVVVVVLAAALATGAGVVLADPPTVSTDPATDIGQASATLHGTLDDMGGEIIAIVYFEYRQQGASTWQTTSQDSLTGTGPFSDTISGLTPATTYEFRSVVTASREPTATGSIETFTTAPPVLPSIEYRDATNSSRVIDNVTVTAETLDGETVAIYNTTNGTVPASALPGSDPLLVHADPEGAYVRDLIVDPGTPRTVVHWLLPDSGLDNASAGVTFELRDATGQFPLGTSQLYLERAIAYSGTDTFRTVLGSDIGDAGHKTVLESGVRYRVRLVSPGGDVRRRGAVEVVDGELIVLEVTDTTIDLTSIEGADIRWGASGVFHEDLQLGSITVTVESEQAAPQFDVAVRIWERSNASNVEVDTTESWTGNASITYNINLPSNATKNWVVAINGTVEWTAPNGSTVTQRFEASTVVGPGIGLDLPLGTELTTILGMAFVLVISALFGGVRSGMGAIVGSLVAGLLWMLGWFGGLLSGGLIVLAIFVGVGYRHAIRGRGVPR